MPQSTRVAATPSGAFFKHSKLTYFSRASQLEKNENNRRWPSAETAAGGIRAACNNAPRRHLDAEQICRIVQGCVERIGRDSSQYGSHSLRAGFVTEAGEHGAGELLIAAQTGHRDLATLRKYFRHTDIFRANAAAQIGL